MTWSLGSFKGVATCITILVGVLWRPTWVYSLTASLGSAVGRFLMAHARPQAVVLHPIKAAIRNVTTDFDEVRHPAMAGTRCMRPKGSTSRRALCCAGGRGVPTNSDTQTPPVSYAPGPPFLLQLTSLITDFLQSPSSDPKLLHAFHEFMSHRAALCVCVCVCVSASVEGEDSLSGIHQRDDPTLGPGSLPLLRCPCPCRHMQGSGTPGHGASCLGL